MKKHSVANFWSLRQKRRSSLFTLSLEMHPWSKRCWALGNSGRSVPVLELREYLRVKPPWNGREQTGALKQLILLHLKSKIHAELVYYFMSLPRFHNTCIQIILQKYWCWSRSEPQLMKVIKYVSISKLHRTLFTSQRLWLRWNPHPQEKKYGSALTGWTVIIFKGLHSNLKKTIWLKPFVLF